MKDDVVDTLLSMGHDVKVDQTKRTSFDKDERFEEAFRKRLKEGYDMVFTMNYFPIISNICESEGILYSSWISDCPNLPLYSRSVSNACNRIFCFDKNECDDLISRGANAYSLALGVNIERLKSVATSENEYLHDVSFLGSFYKNSYNHLEQVANMPQRLRGYIDGISRCQLRLYGYDLIGEAFDAAHVEELSRIALVDLGEQYEKRNADIYRDWIRKNVTVIEREEVMLSIAKRFKISIATDKLPESMEHLSNIKKLGYADYYKDMPAIFRRSKINLNFSLRSILSGIPLRVTDVLGAGGFIITNFQPEMSLYFANGDNIVWFESPEQLLDLIDYYLTHDTEREAIRTRGYETACEVFSYRRLLGILLDAAMS